MTVKTFIPAAVVIALGIVGLTSEAFEVPRNDASTEISRAGDHHPEISTAVAAETRPASARHRRTGESRMVRTDVPTSGQGRDQALRSEIRAGKGTDCLMECRNERRAAALDVPIAPQEGMSARDCRRTNKSGADCDVEKVVMLSAR